LIAADNKTFIHLRVTLQGLQITALIMQGYNTPHI